MKPLLLLLPILFPAFSSAQWTSHDKLALTYFFYWYDATTNKNLTLHPPDTYLSTYTYDNIAFYQRELSDMAAAGIDVALPVYWGAPADVATWSVSGLHLMAQVEQAMTLAGQTVPRIGMFFDTSTPLTVANGGTGPDLTTAAGKSLFYSFIHTFFANVPPQFWATIDGRPILVLYGAASPFLSGYDQSTIDYIAQQFKQDFGTTPYIIRHSSWFGVTTDAAWPSTTYNATFMGDVGSVGPGEDNYSAIAVEKTIVRDRNCGDLYQAHWDQVVAHGARLVLIWDWNELFEGSGISATREYGRRYIDQTARNVARWKSAADPPPYSPPATVWASMGPIFYSSGVYTPLNNGGAAWVATQISGHDALYPDHSWPSYYIYLAADERFLPTRPAGVWVAVEYLDTGTTPWRLEYDGVKGTFWPTAAVGSQNTGQWKVATFSLPDALFEKRENPSTDLRIDDSGTQGNQWHYFNRVWITKSAPTGQPPRMPIVPDVSLAAGSTMDIPVNATDSSGRPLAVSLANAPGFASLQGGAGAQKIHLAPTAADFRTCSDVTGPGVTSTPGYHISAVANDPGSMLGTGATSFTVLVTPPVPVIQQITDSWNYMIGMAPGEWVTIWGAGLAVGAPQSWTVTGTALPTTLNQVTVFFNQTPAVLAYVSSTMINALVPASVQPGPVQVVVQSNGAGSAPFTAAATPTLPAIYAVPDASGKTWFVTATLAGTATLIGNPAVDPRVARAALPGDILDLYLIGLGGTQDASKFITNQVFGGAYPVAARVTATVGGATAPVQFAGLVSPGLYLVRIVVPSGLSPGPQTIQVSAGSSMTTPSIVLMVGAAG
jgi:uncharacterized protein (TIGR03437 family)